MTTTTTQPTAYLVLGEPSMRSAIAFDERGEVLETVEWVDGFPDWTNAGICDMRGAGGVEGFNALVTALKALEVNAQFCGFDVTHVPV